MALGANVALGQAGQDRLEPVIVVQRAAQDALVGRLDLLRQIAEVRLARGRWTAPEKQGFQG